MLRQDRAAWAGESVKIYENVFLAVKGRREETSQGNSRQGILSLFLTTGGRGEAFYVTMKGLGLRIRRLTRMSVFLLETDISKT